MGIISHAYIFIYNLQVRVPIHVSSPGFSKRSAASVKVLVPTRAMLENNDNFAKQKTSHDINRR